MFAKVDEGMFILKMVEFQAGARIMVAHRDEPEMGFVIGEVVDADEKAVRVRAKNGSITAYERKHYEFLVPPNEHGADLAESVADDQLQMVVDKLNSLPVKQLTFLLKKTREEQGSERSKTWFIAKLREIIKAKGGDETETESDDGVPMPDLLSEVERALTSRSSEGKAELIPPMRLRAAMKIAENLLRDGVEEAVLSDPEQLAKLMVQEFSPFRKLSDYDMTLCARAVINKMSLGEDNATLDGAVRIIKRWLDAKTARELWNAIQSGTKASDLPDRFPSIDSDAMGAMLVSLMRGGFMTREQLRECGANEALSRAVASSLLAA